LISLNEARVAIVGGGRFCRVFLEFIMESGLSGLNPVILGVADRNASAEGLVYAAQMGLMTTTDYRELLALEDLEVVFELTRNNRLIEILRKTKPEGVRLIDHFEAAFLWNSLQIEREKTRAKKTLKEQCFAGQKAVQVFDEFVLTLEELIEKRSEYSLRIERNMVKQEWTMSQIIEGSTIPTFVINQDHIVIHWNRAIEKLTGYSAADMVGTDRQWKPFWKKKRPSMADVILDQVDEEKIEDLYGKKWRPSELIEGAYEAEIFFPKLGETGKWCWFTAAPIKDPTGKIVGAIETLWDKTKDKLAEEERDQHHRELAEAQKTRAQIIEGSTIPTFVIDKDHVVTHWNRALEKLTGYSANQIIGTRNHWMPFRPRQRPLMADVILDRFEAGQIQKYYGSKWRRSELIEGAFEAEDFFPSLGESGKWCWFTAAPIKDPGGNIVGAIETLWDKTEDKLAEERKERHTRELTTLCSIYSALNAPLDLELRLTSAIEQIRNLLSVDGICIFLLGQDNRFHLKYQYGTKKSVCGQKYIAGEDSIVYRVARLDKPLIFEDLPKGNNNEIGLFEEEALRSLAYLPVSAKDKKILGVIRLASKSTRHFSDEEKHVLELIGNRIGVAIENSMLHEQYIKSEEKYRSLFNSDPNPIFIIDHYTHKILDTNQRAQDCYGYAAEQLFGRPFLDLGDREDEEIRNGIAGLSRGKSVLFLKKRHCRKDGEAFYVNINVSQAEYGQQDVLIATTTDITENVEKETQLIQASKMTTLGQMAAGIAHEINQPLNVIQVCADFFQKMVTKGLAISKEDLKTLTTDIRDNVQRAAGIIKHMRDFARQSDVVRNRVNINDPIRDVFKVLGHQIKAHNIELILDLDSDIPMIMAEHNRLEQVFINLVTNAIDAMDEKQDRCDSTQETKRLTIRSFAEGDRVMTSVTDTGIGIPASVIDKIVEPFFTTKEVGKGTGLGVSISYGIVKDYDGEIDIKSEIGHGTTFMISFPAIGVGKPPADGVTCL
jgi:PAS domain S-box-containing protein